MSEELKQSQDAEETPAKSPEALLAEYDPESRFRDLTPYAQRLVEVFCLILSLFHIYTAGFGVLQEWKHRAFHLMFVLCLVFLVYSIRRKEVGRKASIIYSVLYGVLGGMLVAMMVKAVMGLASWQAWVLFFLTGGCLFYFKERWWLPSRVIPPIDLVISAGGLMLVAGAGYWLSGRWDQLLADHGWPMAWWNVGQMALIGLVFAWQLIGAARWTFSDPSGFKVDPLKIPYFDIVFAVLAFGLSAYIIVDFDQFLLRAGWPNIFDLVMGFVAICLVLEGCRRSVGVPLTMISLVALVYCYVGPYLLDVPVLSYFAHRGYSIERIIEHMYTGTEGIYGIPLGVCATYVFHFVLFGLFIAYTGLGQLFIDLAMALAGGTPGGPAKVSILASGFLGSISGSSIANTVTTGSFTIPLMKRVGYRSVFAGAVEASASAGGQIMPPIMGAAAFIMAEFLGVPYIKIAIAAILPAFFHFYAVGIMVHFEALKMGMLGLPREELPVLREIIKERGYLFLPLFVIVYLLVVGFTPFLAAFWAIILACSLAQATERMPVFFVPVLLSLPAILFSFHLFGGSGAGVLLWFIALGVGLYITYRRSTPRDWAVGLVPCALLIVLSAAGFRPFLTAFWTNLLVIGIGVWYPESKMKLPHIINALVEGTKNALSIGAAVSAVGLIVGTTMLTGLGLKFGHLTLQLAEGTATFLSSFDIYNLLTLDGMVLFFTLVYTAIACFVLGMGLPTTAQYIVAAIIAAPALLQFGIEPLVSHMFVFFYAILADVTPPVALAAYAASGISGGDPFKTGTISFSLSSAKYVVPFIFVYSPIILLLPWILDPSVGFNLGEFIFIFISVFIGVTGLGAGMRGYLADRSTKVEQVLCFLAALMLFVRGVLPFVIGVGVLTVIYLIQRQRKKKRTLGETPMAA